MCFAHRFIIFKIRLYSKRLMCSCPVFHAGWMPLSTWQPTTRLLTHHARSRCLFLRCLKFFIFYGPPFIYTHIRIYTRIYKSRNEP
jgi:hypothetical protein